VALVVLEVAMHNDSKYEAKVYSPANRRMRRESGYFDHSSKLVSFLYLLLRDEITPGHLEEILKKMSNPETEQLEGASMYTNGWIAKYAENIALRLLESEDA
jgi:hypothetical protein